MKEIKINDDQAGEIANAIILLAAEDYKKAIEDSIQANKYIEDTTRFFGEGWAQLLAGGVNIKDIFKRIDAEAKQNANYSEDYKALINAFARATKKMKKSRMMIFSEDGVFYILNVTAKNEASVKEKAFKLMSNYLEEAEEERHELRKEIARTRKKCSRRKKE